ncbi:MAG TPA: hypothetical protein VH372_02570 [Actinospica sp.]|jgi:hypothetical protein|nr:hypothetical protein [Actinospica sp.]
MELDEGVDDVKSKLPFPFNEDLSPVLLRLNRRTERGRRQLANDPVTAAYLAAALRLAGRHLGPHSPDAAAEGGAGGPGAAEAAEHSLFGFLSQRSVAAEVAGNPDPFPRRGSVSTLRASWRTQSDFVADLVALMLWTGYYPSDYAETLRVGADQLAEAPDFATAVQELAFEITEHLIAMASFRFQLAASLSADADPGVRAVLAAKYERGQTIWGAVYGRMIAARGLKLRAGISLGELADILTATVEGCALRAVAEGPEERVLDRADRRSLLGLAALAIVRGSLEPKDAEDGLSLTDAVNFMVTAPPGGRSGDAAAPAPAAGPASGQGMPPEVPSD